MNRFRSPPGRWFPAGTKSEDLEELSLPTRSRFAFDNDNNAVVLFPTEWALGYFNQTNPKIVLILAAGARLCRVRRDQPQQRNGVLWRVKTPR